MEEKEEYKTFGDTLTAKDLGEPVGEKDSAYHKFRIWVDLGDLIDLDLEAFNDRVSDMVEKGWLSDIHYAVVGHREQKSDHFIAGQVLVEVHAEVDQSGFEEETDLEEQAGDSEKETSDTEETQEKTYTSQESLEMCRRCKWYTFDMDSAYCGHPESFKVTGFGLATHAMSIKGLCTGGYDDPSRNKRQLFEEREPKP